MIKKFEVENFKGFEDTITFDLTAREYEFNTDLVNNGIVNKAIIYGKNGVGKSCLGIALFDIVSHITDKEKMSPIYLRNYLNLNSKKNSATFRYYFQFDNDEIIYEYEKKNQDFLIYEKILINNKLVLEYHYFDTRRRFIDDDLCGSLNIDLPDNKLSVVKYIYRNTPTNNDSVFSKMVKFCENMLWYRSLSEGNSYSGYTNGGAALVDTLYKSKRLKEFQDFLADNGLYYDLSFEKIHGEIELMANFETGKRTQFLSLASTGTKALFLFYIWSISAFEEISLLFIDEFDAFFHYESAENIVLRLNSAKNFQTLLTSHNTYLMQNKLTRPDCCFIMTENKITNLFNATDKEIREAHNLEKMYINGAFNE